VVTERSAAKSCASYFPKPPSSGRSKNSITIGIVKPFKGRIQQCRRIFSASMIRGA